mmetsp:Transcript_42570/g.57876  ORF Transcript_42570/g.57876 Transcript_42570/m.57876 type:complete len:86 (-) Transcript_42570:340-597(-)
MVYMSRLMLLAGSVGLITISALRFSTVHTQSIHQAILNFFFLAFGILLSLTQMGVKFCTRKFRLLNYHWGRSLFCFFIAGISLEN